MTDLDLTKLREIAEAATPGPWEFDVYPTERRSPETGRLLKWKPEYGYCGTVSVIESDGIYGVLNGPDAVHIATFDPPTVLALLDEIERMRATLDAVRELHRPVDVEPSETICHECSYLLPNGRYFGQITESPCQTLRILDGAGAGEGDA